MTTTITNKLHIIEEHYVKSTSVTSNKEFIKYGLTDTIIINLSHTPFLVFMTQEDF